MWVYLDASVLVGLIADETNRPLLVPHLDPDARSILVSDFCVAEVSAALTSKGRRLGLPAASVDQDIARLDVWIDQFADRVRMMAVDVDNATIAIRRPNIALRAPDAIHIAVARRLTATLLTFDRGMARAAASLGVACINPADV
jgi:predicted nucleic acid-binding protein